MMSTESVKHFSDLRKIINSKGVVLYLGAGVSAANNLPSWEKLVLSLYFLTISDIKLKGWRPFSNYLFAISEWYMESTSESLEITARKVKQLYKSDNDLGRSFINNLHQALYGSLLDDRGLPLSYIDKYFIRNNNPTLEAVTNLCKNKGENIQAVITYNYDDLLEIALGDLPFQSIFSNCDVIDDSLSIYHVHGFVPLSKEEIGSKPEDIVFTEDQYHSVASTPYYWSNLIQIKCMSNSVGLMIGLSMSDPNMRRLLDAIQKAPVKTKNYALLRKPDDSPPDDATLDRIHENAKNYLQRFEHGGIKSEYDMNYQALYKNPGEKSSMPVFDNAFANVKGPSYRYQVAGIIEQVKAIGQKQQEDVLEALGVIPIWYEHHSEIPEILNKIRS